MEVLHGVAGDGRGLPRQKRFPVSSLSQGCCRRSFRCAAAAVYTGSLFFACNPLHGQTPPAPAPNRTVNLNYVYAAELGFGGYSLDGLSAQVYTLPLDYTFPDVLRDGWELKILAPLELGLYSFKATDTDGERISLEQQSLAVVPGAELQIPVGSHTVVKPFGQFGVGHTFGVESGSPNSYIYLAGVRSISQWHAGATTFSLGDAAIYAGDSPIGSGFSEHYISLQVGVEVRHPLGFTVGKLAPDLGIYTIYYYYPEPLVFNRFLQPNLNVTNQGEVGFSVGSATPFRLLGLSSPRIGAGLIFGGGLTVWRINFGFQF
jgi:hypothetical protein